MSRHLCASASPQPESSPTICNGWMTRNVKCHCALFYNPQSESILEWCDVKSTSWFLLAVFSWSAKKIRASWIALLALRSQFLVPWDNWTSKLCEQLHQRFINSSVGQFQWAPHHPQLQRSWVYLASHGSTARWPHLKHPPQSDITYLSLGKKTPSPLISFIEKN